MHFTVSVRSPSGKTRNILIEAPNRDRAGSMAATKIKPDENILFIVEGKGGVTKKQKLLPLNTISDFCLDLSELLAGSNSFTEALTIIGNTDENPDIRKLANRMLDREKGGADVSQNFEGERGFLGNIAVALAIQGEASHSLSQNLETASKIIDRQIKQKASIVKAMAMPMIAISILIIVSTLAFAMLIPNLKAQMGNRITPNIITQFAYFISDLLLNYWVLWGALGAVFVYMLFFTPIIKNAVLGFLIKRFKLAKRAFLASEQADLCMLFGSLVARNISTKDAMIATSLRFVGKPLEKQLLRAAEMMTVGSGVHEAMQMSTNLDPKTLSAFKVGERSGSLGEHLVQYSDRLYYRSDRAFEKFSNIISVTAILAMGGMVIFTFISSYGPLLQYLQENMSGRN